MAALPRTVREPNSDDEPLLWIEGARSHQPAPLWVPYEVVHTDYTMPRGPAHGCFLANTNGLASGNHILEAVSHGIHEVIERDATTLWKYTRRRSRRALDLATVDDEACRWVLDRFAQADIAVKVWDTTSDVGIASFNCLVLASATSDWHDRGIRRGVPSRAGIALLRALTEAAQARTTYIAGSRDDFRSEDYTPAERDRRLRECRTLMDADVPVRDFHDVPPRDRDSLDEDVSWALERLLAVGRPAGRCGGPDQAGAGATSRPGRDPRPGGARRTARAATTRRVPGPELWTSARHDHLRIHGPDASVPDARSVLDAVYLPPVRQGDVYRTVVRHRPRAVGIIDGYFQPVPSVWHKEILWAMAQGVHVFGSASMGALRAAELAPFGMRGVGRDLRGLSRRAARAVSGRAIRG